MNFNNKRPDAVVVGKNIACFRKQKGMTQQELADILSVTNKTISKWECGRGLPDITQFPNIEKLFDITHEELVSDFELFERDEDVKKTISYKQCVLISVLSIISVLSVLTGILLPLHLSFDKDLSPPSDGTEMAHIDGAGSYILEAEDSAYSDGLFVSDDEGSGHGYLGGFACNESASMRFVFIADGIYQAGLYFRLSPCGFDDFCCETYTIILNGLPVYSSTVFRREDQCMENFEEYFIAAVETVDGQNVLEIIFNRNTLCNNGHNFDYARLDTRYREDFDETGR